MTSLKTKLATLAALQDVGSIETTDFALMTGAQKGRVLSKTMTQDMGDVLWLDSEGKNYPAEAYGGTERFSVCPQLQQPVEIINMPQGKDDGACVFNHQILPLKQVDARTVCLKYGAFPQTVASSKSADILDDLSQKGKLKKTGNHYTAWSYVWGTMRSVRKTLPEYEYHNRRYVSVMLRAGEDVELSDGSSVKTGERRWLEVQPLEWIVHPTTKVALSRKAVLGGLDWGMEDLDISMYHDSGIAHYLKKHFDTEMMQSHQFCKMRGFVPTLAEKAENQIAGAKAYVAMRFGLKPVSVVQPRLVMIGRTYPEWRRIWNAAASGRSRE